MNELIESIFADFSVNSVAIPVCFLRYDGKKDTYITYQQMDADNSFSGDDGLLGYADYYDFDIYSKGNYFPIVEKVIEVLEDNNFVWQPSRSSGDMYEDDTGYYHKTLNFAFLKEVKTNGTNRTY